ncbi:acyl-coenzyme A thioesterase 1-like [Haliotis rubra]|uniref:acyl-coenzyme A thioesterase 1-like n=1 Tax=Haliotis rubra TaxID=36100 RepID=UPI001EE55C54|nr:acyl-coenzyme A thioesterase 1-like [Haliotis rubra]
MVCLNVNPRVALVDEKVSITVNSLRPQQRVTILLRVEEGKVVFNSCAHFLTDQQGQVNVSQHASLGGTYRGVDSMGLFWSLKPVPGISKASLLRKIDVTTPLVFRLSVLDDHVPFDDLRLSTPVVKGHFLQCSTCLAQREGVTEFRAALLASRGFACFALAYFRYDDLPTSLADIDFDYFLNAVDWLASHPSVQPGGIGVVGTSKGGELAFLLGMSTDQAWTNNAKILYLCGEDDSVWRTDFANTFIVTCPEEKRKNIELIVYPGAGHLIEPPYMPVSTSLNNKALGMKMVMGGQTEAHAAAQEDAWRRLLHFLETHLSQ